VSGDDTAVVIAIVGVFGTLAGTVGSQYLAARSQRRQLEYQDKATSDQRKHDEDMARLESKRACYVQFMATARNYRLEILNLLHSPTEKPDRQHLEEARREFVTCFAEAQLVASPDVLSKLEPFNLGLAAAYHGYTNGQRGTGIIHGDAFEIVDQSLKDIWDNQWQAMRESMRRDLTAQN
jgi:hypothetical protein